MSELVQISKSEVVRCNSYEFMTPNGSEITLAKLARTLTVDYQTVRRWALEGRCGVKLRVCRLSNGLGSSTAEHLRWLIEITEAAESRE